MAMKLEQLAQLHSSMDAQGMTKAKFDFRFRNLMFSIIYIAEQFPHELLFGCRAHNLFFVVEVPSSGFIICTYLGDAYGALLEALGLKSNPTNRFSPNILFEEFKTAIPQSTSPANSPTITDIAFNRRDVEESDKIYFCGWQTHDGVRIRPTKGNLEKTKRICGLKVHEICYRNHISSKWTDNQKLAQQYHEPGT